MKDFFEEEVVRLNSGLEPIKEFTTDPIDDGGKYKLNIVANINNASHGPRVKVMKGKNSVMELPLSKDSKALDNGEVIAGNAKNRNKLSRADKEIYDIARDICYNFSERIINFEYGRSDSKDINGQLEDDINNYITKMKVEKR